MQFVTFGNRIATENFNIGFFYKITFTDNTSADCTCIGIGANFVNFQREEPELLFSLTLDSASNVLSIDFLGGGGTDDYEELSNKPQINSVELIGNKSLSDLGIQAEITAEDPLSSSLVSGLGTAAAANTTDFATSAQGALAATAVQPADLNAYQTKIDAEHLLSADLVDDTSTTNKFATAAELAQIETNKTNILSINQHYICDNDRKLYISATEPTGDIPTGSTWIDGKSIKTYGRTDNQLEINAALLNANNWTLTGVYYVYYSIRTLLNLPSGKITASAFLKGTAQTNKPFGISTNADGALPSANRFVNSTGNVTTQNLVFTINDGDDLYIAIGDGTMISGKEQAAINAIFNNYNLMITIGENSPTEYMPYYDWQ